MNEWMLKRALENNEAPLSEKAIAARLTRARKVERLLTTDLDYIVASEERMYQALLLLKSSPEERKGNLQNALRWYYRAINGRTFPRLEDYSAVEFQRHSSFLKDGSEPTKRDTPKSKGESRNALNPTEPIGKLWEEYCSVRKRITGTFGRTNNVVGELGERIVAECHNGGLLEANYSSADVRLRDGGLVQVKARMCSKGGTTSLGAIRSWNFDLLAIVLFNADGEIVYGGEIPSDVARKYAKESAHVNGWVITTSKGFLSDPSMVDVTRQYVKTLESL